MNKKEYKAIQSKIDKEDGINFKSKRLLYIIAVKTKKKEDVDLVYLCQTVRKEIEVVNTYLYPLLSRKFVIRNINKFTLSEENKTKYF